MAVQLPVVQDSNADTISNVVGDTLVKAKLELNEDPETRKQSIYQLRQEIENWTPSSKDTMDIDLSVVRKDQNFLLMFLRARKFDIKKSLTLYINYHSYRHKHSDILYDLNFKSVEHVLHSGVVGVLDSRLNDGSKVICVYPGKWDMDRIPFVDTFRATLILLDKLIQDEETQVHGFSVLYDFQGASFMSMIKVAQSEQIQKGMLIELLQDAFPARFKAVHVVNQPWYVSVVLSIIRPFLKQKLRDRIHMHGTDLDGLHSHINPELLPVEFGGSLGQPDSPTDVKYTLDLFQDE